MHITDGYRHLYMPGHPLADSVGYVREHRLVWEQAYGPIPDDCVVHHRDGDKMNNVLDNLEMMTRADHAELHHGRMGRWAPGYDACVDCGTTERRHNARGMCMRCYGRWWAEQRRAA